MNDYNFGNFICYLREQKGYTQADIAKMLDVTPAAVSKWENGESKPRIETLFRLAEILGVKAEELIAGKLLHEEAFDPDAVKRINERYEYLRIMDSRSSGSVKLRRILAWIIDWNISGLTAILLMLIAGGICDALFGQSSEVTAFVILLCILSYPVMFILRDLIGRGRSIGKRITGLVVLNRDTMTKAMPSKLVIRNILLIIIQIDFIVLLIRGESLGDSIARTAVVLKKEIENREEIQSIPEPSVINSSQEMPLQIEKINSYQTPPHAKKRSAVKVIVITFAILFLLVVGILSVAKIALEGVKTSEQYEVAYTYLINSDSFKLLDIDEERISLQGYEINTHLGSTEGYEKTAEFSFLLGNRGHANIICHSENGEWYVCEDCTQIE